MSNYQKLFVGLLVATVVFGIGFVQPAKAQTVGELAQQIAQLQALLAQLQGLQGTPAPTTGVPVPPLSEGSTGPEVEKLQRWLVAQGSLVMPAGGSYGFFGPLTKAALASWQAANGVAPAEGVYGNITYNKILAMGPVTPPPVLPPVLPPAGLPAGCTSTVGFSPTTGVSCSTVITLPAGCTSTAGYSPTTGLICSTVVNLPAGCTSTTGYSSTTGLPCTGTTTTTGTEGVLAAELNPTPSSGSVVRGGAVNAPLLGIKLKAIRSDLALQSIRVNLGTSLTIATKILQNLKLYDPDGNLLAEFSPLLSNVNEEGTTRFIVFSGFNYTIPKDTTRVLTIKGDLFTNVSSNTGTKTLTIPANGVRTVDGAGVDQKGPSTAFSNSVDAQTALVDSSALVVSLSTDSPLARQVIAVAGSSLNEIDELEIAKVNLRATGDNVKVRTWPVTVTKSGTGGATASTAYLYDGTSMVSSASITSGLATFSSLEFIVPKDTTKTFTLKAKITSANNTDAGFAASTTGAVITAENSEGSTVTPTGTASSSEIAHVLDTGLEISLVSKNVTTNGVPQSSTPNTYSTSTLSAVFTVKLKAVDSSVLLGTTASGTPAFASSTTGFKVYRNGTYDGTVSSAATTTSYATPSGYTVTNNTYTLNDRDEVTVPVTFSILGRNAASTAVAPQGSQFAVGLEGVQWTGNGGAITSNFMTGNSSWRTPDVTFP